MDIELKRKTNKEQLSLRTNGTFKWDERLSVNNYIIDNQHKTLIKLINNLVKNSDAKTNSELIGDSLSHLLEYSRIHFKEEEEFLKNKNYIKLDEHKNIHEKFKYDIAMFCKDVIEGKKGVTVNITNYLIDWMENHISKEDQDYKNYF